MNSPYRPLIGLCIITYILELGCLKASGGMELMLELSQMILARDTFRIWSSWAESLGVNFMRPSWVNASSQLPTWDFLNIRSTLKKFWKTLSNELWWKFEFVSWVFQFSCAKSLLDLYEVNIFKSAYSIYPSQELVHTNITLDKYNP